MLGRQGTAAELSSWVQSLGNGTSREQVVADFLDSSEAAGREVEGSIPGDLTRRGRGEFTDRDRRVARG